MSVVGPDYEELKRFNLQELRQPASSAAPEAAEDANKATENKPESKTDS